MGLYPLVRAALRRGRLPDEPLDPVDRTVALPPPAIARYAAWLGVPADPPPLTWLYPWAQSAHLELLTDRAVRAPVVGMVHAGNVIARIAPIPASAQVALRLVEVDPIAGRRALRIDTLWRHEGGLVAAMRSTYLVRGRAPRASTGPRPPSDPLPERAAERAWPASAGRAYAAVSGDYNPIHLAAPLARLAGQRRAILHGLALAAAAWVDDGARATAQEITFRRPVLLPGRTVTERDPGRGVFRVVGADGTVHALGRHGQADLAAALLAEIAP